MNQPVNAVFQITSVQNFLTPEIFGWYLSNLIALQKSSSINQTSMSKYFELYEYYDILYKSKFFMV